MEIFPGSKFAFFLPEERRTSWINKTSNRLFFLSISARSCVSQRGGWGKKTSVETAAISINVHSFSYVHYGRKKELVRFFGTHSFFGIHWEKGSFPPREEKRWTTTTTARTTAPSRLIAHPGQRWIEEQQQLKTNYTKAIYVCMCVCYGRHR